MMYRRLVSMWRYLMFQGRWAAKRSACAGEYDPGFCKKPNMLRPSTSQDEHVVNAITRVAANGKCACATVGSDRTVKAVNSVVTYIDELPDPRHSQFKIDSNLI